MSYVYEELSVLYNSCAIGSIMSDDRAGGTFCLDTEVLCLLRTVCSVKVGNWGSSSQRYLYDFNDHFQKLSVSLLYNIALDQAKDRYNC